MPARTETPPICLHFGICGGCTIQHLSYLEQLAFKEAALRKRLSPGLPFATPLFAGIDEDLRAPQGFRQKVAFVFGPGRGGRGLIMGHYERASRRIVPVE